MTGLKIIALDKAYVVAGTSYDALEVKSLTAGMLPRVVGKSAREMISLVAADAARVPVDLFEVLPSRVADDVYDLVEPELNAFAAATGAHDPGDDAEPAAYLGPPPPSFTVALAEPVVVGTTLRVTELELKEPTGKQLATAEREPNQARIYITLASLCSGLPRAAIEKLPLPAFTEGVAYLRGFTTGARWTGRR